MSPPRESAPLKSGGLRKCGYCDSALVAGDRGTVACDVCQKLSHASDLAPWRPEEARPHVEVALLEAGLPSQPEREREIRQTGRTARPHRVKIERRNRSVLLRFRDWRRGDPARIATAAAFLVFVGVWLSGRLRGAPGYEGSVPGVALMGAAVVAVLWNPLGRFLTPVTLKAESSGLEVRSGLLGRKRQFVERARLQQLYCQLRTIPATEDHPAEERFHLVALLRDQTTLELGELSDPDAALYLERELENTLDIVDRPVS